MPTSMPTPPSASQFCNFAPTCQQCMVFQPMCSWCMDPTGGSASCQSSCDPSAKVDTCPPVWFMCMFVWWTKVTVCWCLCSRQLNVPVRHRATLATGADARGVVPIQHNSRLVTLTVQRVMNRKAVLIAPPMPVKSSLPLTFELWLLPILLERTHQRSANLRTLRQWMYKQPRTSKDPRQQVLRIYTHDRSVPIRLSMWQRHCFFFHPQHTSPHGQLIVSIPTAWL